MTLVIYWTFGLFLQSVLLFLEIFISEDVRWKFIRNFQGWFMIQFSMFFFLVANLRLMTCAPSGASFSCCYQQLLYLITDSSICQQLFYLFFSGSLVSFWKAVLSSDSLYIIIHNFTFVNNFFYFFYIFFLQHLWYDVRVKNLITWKHLIMHRS